MKVTVKANDRPAEVIRSHQKIMIDYGCAFGVIDALLKARSRSFG